MQLTKKNKPRSQVRERVQKDSTSTLKVNKWSYSCGRDCEETGISVRVHDWTNYEDERGDAKIGGIPKAFDRVLNVHGLALEHRASPAESRLSGWLSLAGLAVAD